MIAAFWTWLDQQLQNPQPVPVHLAGPVALVLFCLVLLIYLAGIFFLSDRGKP